MGCTSSSIPARDPKGEAAFRAKYKLGRKLGSGAFAKVSAVEPLTGAASRALAAKVVPFRQDAKGAAEARQALKDQCELWAELGSHKHLVELLDVFVSPQDSAAIMLMPRCNLDLSSCIANARENVEAFGCILHCVVSGLEHMHALRIAHRDVKPSNVMLTGDASAKLCDFRAAARLPAMGVFSDVAGTAPYMAPELAGAKPYDLSVDMWAVGVCCYQGIYGELPYVPSNGERSAVAYKVAIVEGRPLAIAATGEDAARIAKAVAFMQRVLQRRKALRPTATKALTRDFLRDRAAECELIKGKQDDQVLPDDDSTASLPSSRATPHFWREESGSSRP